MIRAHKIRLNPTPSQALYFRRAAGVARFTYNWALDRWQWAKRQGMTEYGMAAAKKDFNAIKREKFPWTWDVCRDASNSGFENLADSLKNYFESKTGKRKGRRMGFPKFKTKKKAKLSFHIACDKFILDGRKIHIPKLGWVNMTESLRFDGKMKTATVSKVADWWYVSIVVDIQQPEPKQFARDSTGVDVGIKTLATLADGSEFENQKPLRRQLNRLRILSRSLSRRQQGSNRWYKAKHKLERFHATITNRRSDMHHKASHTIASAYAFIGVENLNVLGMLKNRRLSRAISDVGLGEFIRQIEYKSNGFGGRTVRVGRFYASSKTCNDCGYIHQILALSDRKWTCSECGVIHERDWNAAKNIEQEALRLIA